MSRWIDKKTAARYEVVHRSHRDPLYHAQDAPERVLRPVEGKRGRPSTSIAWLEEQLGNIQRRDNEGEASLYGVYYDDSSYDYMQHLRPVDEGPALDETLPHEVLPQQTEVLTSYQDQQEVPDALSGFQPDMDPSLREVLEALEDEAYVDQEEDGFFSQLAVDGERSDREDEDCDSDDTAKGVSMQAAHDNTPGSRKKKIAREARSISSGYSMSSSSVFRNAGLTLLDDRFDQIEEEYDQSDEGEQEGEMNGEFMSVMDEFLNHKQVKGKRVQPKASGLEQLNEIRQQLRTTRIM